MSDITLVTQDTFDLEVLNAKGKVVVDFFADWCGPCKMFGAIYEEVATEYSDKAKFVKMNVDDAGDFARKYGVRGIPTVILFDHGAAIATNSGAINKTAFVSFLDSNL